MRSRELAILWTLRHGKRMIECVAGTHPPAGLEVWVSVNGRLRHRQPFADSEALLRHAAICRAQLEARGWTASAPEPERAH